jgi:hypothetical protein
MGSSAQACLFCLHNYRFTPRQTSGAGAKFSFVDPDEVPYGN